MSIEDIVYITLSYSDAAGAILRIRAGLHETEPT